MAARLFTLRSREARMTEVHGEILLVIFGLESQRYALNLSVVERVLPMAEVSPLPEAPAITLGVINLHGQVIPVLDIRRRFGLPVRDYGLNTHLLVARATRRTLALPVDEVLGVKEIAVVDVTLPETVLSGIGRVEGIVTLPDGLLFIHNLDTFLSLDEEQRLMEALEAKDE
jgi:purine-binding chemotaxis protein CheW